MDHAELVSAGAVVVGGEHEFLRQGKDDGKEVHVVHQLERAQRRSRSNHLVQLASHTLPADLCSQEKEKEENKNERGARR